MSPCLMLHLATFPIPALYPAAHARAYFSYELFAGPRTCSLAPKFSLPADTYAFFACMKSIPRCMVRSASAAWDRRRHHILIVLLAQTGTWNRST